MDESPRKRSLQQNRRVQFCKRVTVRRTFSINQLSSEEWQRIWFDRQDFHQMKQRELELSHRAEESSFKFETMMLNIYGISSQSRKKARDERIHRYIRSVLLEQERQWAEDTKDEHLLSQVCSNLTLGSHKVAHSRAVQLWQFIAGLNLDLSDLDLSDPSEGRQRVKNQVITSAA